MLRKTFSCSELCTRLDINKNDLSGIVRDMNLRVLNNTYSLVEIKDNAYFYKDNRSVGAGAVCTGGPLAITDENGFYFLSSDVDAFEKEYGKILQGTTTDSLQEKNKKSTLPAYEYAFIHDGDAWEIWFKGIKLKPIKEMDGMIYIANLIKNPGKWVHVTDLCASASRRKGKAMMTEDDMTASLKDGNMSISTMQDDGLDNQSKETLRERIDELEEMIANSTLSEGVREQAENERSNLIKVANKLYGKKSIYHRAPKKVNESVKKDLDRAGNAIDRAYDKIRKQSPELADYLKNTIKKGTHYSFTDIGTSWFISM